MFAVRFSLSIESDLNSMLHFFGTTCQALKLSGKPGKSQENNYELSNREMTRKVRKSRENYNGYKVKALQLDYGN